MQLYIFLFFVFTDHAAIPDFSAGAMENWGLVLYRETALLFDPEFSSISAKYWVTMIMAHEIAHSVSFDPLVKEFYMILCMNQDVLSISVTASVMIIKSVLYIFQEYFHWTWKCAQYY